jgi:CP family cyanate transporter-like MFS transporter
LKREFPGKIAAITGAYALTMGVAAALGSAIVVPLAQMPGVGWPLALGLVALLPLMAIVPWLPQLGGHTAPAKGTATPPHDGRVWRSVLAWQVTLFMGLTSLIYYFLISWLPAILADAGFSPEQAGSLHGIMQLATAVPGLILAPMVGRMRDQRALAAGSGLLTTVSLLGFLLLPAWATLWTILFGLGTGAAIILALTFISLRVRNTHQAAVLSGMAQCVGYLLAAIGPTLMGLLHDISGNWRMPLALNAVLSVVLAVFGLLAGRNRHIVEDPRQTRSQPPPA